MLITTRRSPLMPLTERQLTFLMDAYCGLTNKQIAEKRNVGEGSVKDTFWRIYRTLETERLIRPASNRRVVACVWLHRLLTRECGIETVIS